MFADFLQCEAKTGSIASSYIGKSYMCERAHTCHMTKYAKHVRIACKCICTDRVSISLSLNLRMAQATSPEVVNVADRLKQIQSANSQNRLPQNVVIGQGSVVTQHNSVLLGGTTSSASAACPTTGQGHMNYSYKVKIINPVKKSDVIV